MSKDILNLVIQNNFTLFTINENKKPYSVCYKETYIWNNLMSSVNIYKARHTRGMFDSTLVRSSKLINLSSPFYLPIIQIYRMVLSNDDTAVGLKRGWVFSLFQEPVTLEIVSWRFHTQVYSSLSFFPANLNHQISPTICSEKAFKYGLKRDFALRLFIWTLHKIIWVVYEAV